MIAGIHGGHERQRWPATAPSGSESIDEMVDLRQHQVYAAQAASEGGHVMPKVDCGEQGV